MATDTKQILKQALKLPAVDRANLADRLLSSLDQPDEHINALWREEIDDRISAYKAGELRAISVNDVLEKYNK